MRFFFTHGYSIMARRRKKSPGNFFLGLLRNLFLNSFFAIAAILLMLLWLKFIFNPVLNGVTSNMVTTQQNALQENQRVYQQSLQQQRNIAQQQVQERKRQIMQEERRILEQQRLAAAVAEQEHIRAERKRQAWEKFHQRSPSCQRDPNTVACANAYIAAKRRFEREYVDTDEPMQ